MEFIENKWYRIKSKWGLTEYENIAKCAKSSKKTNKMQHKEYINVRNDRGESGGYRSTGGTFEDIYEAFEIAHWLPKGHSDLLPQEVSFSIF